MNIKKKDSGDIINLLNSFNREISLVVLTNSKQVRELYDSCGRLNLKIAELLPRREYLYILSEVDSLLVFVTDMESYSSNKIMDSIAIGVPVTVGIYSMKQANKDIPGFFEFNIKNPISFEKAIKSAAMVKNDLVVTSEMKQYALSLYQSQIDSLNLFLEKIILMKNKDKSH
jgi:hypothetical protein